MQFRLLKLRFRRRIRKGARQVEDFSVQTEENIERHIFGRFSRLAKVKRFVIGWTLLVLVISGGVLIQNFMLSGYFQALRPVPGGIYSEGELGTFSGASPLYAVGTVDRSVSRLIFAGLLTYDSHNKLVGDLAKDISVDEHGTIYTVHLKPNLSWQDGKPLTSADVVFTYKLIQNPDAKSPLLAGWQGIEVSAPDANTVQFKLPNILASFPANLTTGIVPEHLLKDVPAADLRTADFNTVHPVGAGPFMWRTIQVSGNDPSVAEEQITLLPFANYAGGKPKLDEFIIHAFADRNQLIDSYSSGQLSGLEGLNAVPAKLQGTKSLEQHNLLLTAGTYAFFKTSVAPLNDVAVRQALIQSVDTQSVAKSSGYPTRQVKEPILMGQLAYDAAYAQAGFDAPAAKKALDTAGWVVGKHGVRTKDGKPLAFVLTANDTDEYRHVGQRLVQAWQSVGVKASLRLQNDQDFQTTLAYHDYDAVLYGISIGVDPDVFVYWDSSQANIRSANRLNLSEYKNATADVALEAGRTRLDPSLRAIKYKPFLQAWQQDAPALGLYQPRLLYITNGPVSGLGDHVINTSADRFNNVQNWQIRQARVTNP